MMSRFWRRVNRILRKRITKIGLAILFVCALFYGALFSSPFMFPRDSYVRIEQGSVAAEVSQKLKEEHIIRSSFVFNLLVRWYGDEGIIPGEYYFAGRQGLFTVVYRVTNGSFDIEPIKVTIPEGTSVRGIADLLSDIPDFDEEVFYELAQDKEGRLYPDTYFIFPGEDPALVLQRLEENFKTQITHPSVSVPVAAFGKPFDEVLVMASLLEKEANNSHDRRLIAGILWSRIEQGIPLQVDAVFPYIIGKGTYDLTLDDLQTDSPYNTYVHKGLPPGPITNPGIDAIIDAVTPTNTDYLFYLADRSGTTYYSVTYEQHLRNRAKYIGS